MTGRGKNRGGGGGAKLKSAKKTDKRCIGRWGNDTAEVVCPSLQSRTRLQWREAKRAEAGSRGRRPPNRAPRPRAARERELFIDNLLVRIHYIIVMSRWTGLAPLKFEFPFPGSLTSTFLVLALQGVASA